MSKIQVQMIDCSVSSNWWKKLIKHFIRIGDELEIRCWKEETVEIQWASLYGKLVEDVYEVSIRGTVTPELLAELLTEEPIDKNIYNKMTKYFTINTKNELCNFSSFHYGTEIYINGVSSDDITFFSKMIDPYNDRFSIYIEV